jgi:hypothetical protein
MKFEEPRQASRGFELFMQLSYVSSVLVGAAMGEPVARAVVPDPDGDLIGELEDARREYDELDRVSRVRSQLRRARRRL